MYRTWRAWHSPGWMSFSVDELLQNPSQDFKIFGGESSLGNGMDVDNDLKCPICLDLFKYPIILPCSHILCREPCAENLFDFDFIRCPVCRDNCYISGGISSLPRVITLENIIDKFKAERRKSVLDQDEDNSTPDNVPCQFCDKPPKTAKKSCLDCNASYCVNCLRLSHPNREPFMDHEFVEPRKELQSSSVCSEHGQTLTLYCYQCRRPYCLACDETEVHASHHTVSVEEGYVNLKMSLLDGLERLTETRGKLTTTVKLQQENLKDLQLLVNRRREEINTQCDSLVAEIENKRNFFLADLENEEHACQNSADDTIKLFEKILGSSQSLETYTEDMLNRDAVAFLEVASALTERIARAESDCESCQYQPCDLENVKNKVIDFRKERAALRDLHYLSPPSTSIIDVTRCSRSEDTVALILAASKPSPDVVDTYEVHYCSDEQKTMGLEITLTALNCPEDRHVIKSLSNSSNFNVLLLDSLYSATTYYFCVAAANAVGKSDSSEVVQCRTLSQSESVVPVPVILETLCRRFMSSIQICSSSPLDVALEQKVTHFLLYRPVSQGQGYLWKSVALYGREEHRVFGLESNTEYEFIILACNPRGECQLSNKVTLQTQISAI